MSKITCISYGSKGYEKELNLNIKTAMQQGADEAIGYGPDDIDEDYKRKNIRFFERKRGNGYWLWKPYLIDRCLEKMTEGDWLIYVDAGLFYLNNLREFVNDLERKNLELVVAPTIYKEFKYTKRDIFVKTQTDVPAITQSLQRQSGAIFIRKNEKNVAFVKEWLRYIQMDSLVTDDENVYGLPNYDGFVENRHDQSLLSVISKKMGVGTEMSLYDDVIEMKTSKKILCYHHSQSGNKEWIYIKARVRKVLGKR